MRRMKERFTEQDFIAMKNEVDRKGNRVDSDFARSNSELGIYMIRKLGGRAKITAEGANTAVGYEMFRLMHQRYYRVTENAGALMSPEITKFWGISCIVPRGLAGYARQPSVQGVGVRADPEQEPRQCPTWIDCDVRARSAIPGLMFCTLVHSLATLRGCATKSQPLPTIVAPRQWTLVSWIVRMPHSVTIPNSLQQKSDKRSIWMRSPSAPRT